MFKTSANFGAKIGSKSELSITAGRTASSRLLQFDSKKRFPRYADKTAGRRCRNWLQNDLLSWSSAKGLKGFRMPWGQELRAGTTNDKITLWRTPTRLESLISIYLQKPKKKSILQR